MHFHYRVTFTGYIRCFCATASHDLVTLTFDLLTLRVCHESVSCTVLLRLRNDLYCVEWGVKLYSLTHCTVLLMSDPHTNFYYSMTTGHVILRMRSKLCVQCPCNIFV